MTEIEVQQLFVDLCGRLAYGVRCRTYLGDDFTLKELNRFSWGGYGVNGGAFAVSEVRPYLRPLQSMTEDEVEMYFRVRRPDTIDVVRPSHFCGDSICAVVDGLYMRYWYNDLVSLETLDWLNSRHLDYRGLIGKGLAIEAPEGMY